MERRARMAVRHLLAPGAQVDRPEQVVDGILALHATDPATVHLSALIRLRGGTVGAVEEALYERRSLVRILGMRRSMFVVGLDVAPIVQAACSVSVAAAQRRRLVMLLGGAGVGPDVEGWLVDVERSVLAAVRARGGATAQELARDEPRLRTSLVMAEGKPYEAVQNITSRVLFQLAAEGHIVRGRPQGGWTTNNYVWSPIESWLPGGMPELDTATARVELVQRWLATFGPAPLEDLKWWTGLGVRDLRAALAVIRPVEVDLEGGAIGLVLADDVDAVEAPGPWAALLPGLDPMPMGWHERSWFLPPDISSRVMDRTGNIGPTVWWDGHVVGGWSQRRDGEIVYRLLEDVGAEAGVAVAAAAATLTERIGTARVTPRFPAPLDRELTA
ncbi:MAG: winged helix DNA-binding domain-containing protein [Pseudonocardia sp.]